MDVFKLNIIIDNAQIELEGQGELVYKIFQELKENGLGKLTPLTKEYSSNLVSANNSEETSKDVPKIENTDNLKDDPILLNEDFPALQNVVLQGTPQTEKDWLLVYAAYCSEQGESLFTRDDLRTKYDETNRKTITREKNFSTNVKSLISDNYISAVNDTEFRLEGIGLERAKKILLNPSSERKAKQNSSSGKKKTPMSYSLLNLDLSEEQRISFRDFWNKHEHSSNMDKAVIIAYWLKREKSINDYTPNHLFTMLRTIEENTSFDISAAIRNAKNTRHFFSYDSDNKAYTLTHIGEDRVTAIETIKEEGK